MSHLWRSFPFWCWVLWGMLGNLNHQPLVVEDEAAKSSSHSLNKFRAGKWEWLAQIMSFASKLEAQNKNGLNFITRFVQALGQIDILSNTTISRDSWRLSAKKRHVHNIFFILWSTSQLSFVCENWLILILKFLANLSALPSHMGIVKSLYKGSWSTNQISWNAMSVFLAQWFWS